MRGVRGAILAAAVVAFVAAPVRADTIKDEKYGYTMSVPAKFKRIPMPSDEEWIIAKYLSERTFPTKDGWDFTPELRVVYLPPSRKDKPKADVKKSGDGTTTVVVGGKKSYRDFKSYLQDNAAEGGWYISKEEETTVNGIKATWMEIKWEKLTTPRHGLAVVFHRETGAEYAVSFEVLEEQWDKLGREMTNHVRTFKFTEAKGDISGAATSGGDEAPKDPPPGPAVPPEVKVGPDGKPVGVERDWAAERRKERDKAIKKELDHARANLPKGWRETKSKNFYCFTHADEKYTKRVLDQAEGMRSWVEKTFGTLGTGDSPPRIIRICENREEERAYHSGSRGFSWGGADVYTTNQEEIGSGLDALGWMNSWVLNNWIEDRDSEAFNSAPTWLRTGLQGFVSTGVLAKGRFDFRPDMYEIQEMRKSAKEGKLLTVKEIFAADWEVFDKVEGSWTQCRGFVRFLLDGPGAQDKRLKGRMFEVLKAGGDIRRERDEARRKKDGDAAPYKEAETEEEEEAQAKKRNEEWKTEEKEFLAEVTKRAFKDLTDADWAAIDRTWKAWAAQYQ